MALMGDWRNDKDWEVNLDGIGGVNILVKADVHRSGEFKYLHNPLSFLRTLFCLLRPSLLLFAPFSR